MPLLQRNTLNVGAAAQIISEASTPLSILLKLASRQHWNVIDLLKNKDMALVFNTLQQLLQGSERYIRALQEDHKQ